MWPFRPAPPPRLWRLCARAPTSRPSTSLGLARRPARVRRDSVGGGPYPCAPAAHTGGCRTAAAAGVEAWRWGRAGWGTVPLPARPHRVGDRRAPLPAAPCAPPRAAAGPPQGGSPAPRVDGRPSRRPRRRRDGPADRSRRPPASGAPPVNTRLGARQDSRAGDPMAPVPDGCAGGWSVPRWFVAILSARPAAAWGEGAAGHRPQFAGGAADGRAARGAPPHTSDRGACGGVPLRARRQRLVAAQREGGDERPPRAGGGAATAAAAAAAAAAATPAAAAASTSTARGGVPPRAPRAPAAPAVDAWTGRHGTHRRRGRAALCSGTGGWRTGALGPAPASPARRAIRPMCAPPAGAPPRRVCRRVPPPGPRRRPAPRQAAAPAAGIHARRAAAPCKTHLQRQRWGGGG